MGLFAFSDDIAAVDVDVCWSLRQEFSWLMQMGWAIVSGADGQCLWALKDVEGLLSALNFKLEATSGEAEKWGRERGDFIHNSLSFQVPAVRSAYTEYLLHTYHTNTSLRRKLKRVHALGLCPVASRD